jgi:diguanylate cyclase (GGDEF)-like protein
MCHRYCRIATPEHALCRDSSSRTGYPLLFFLLLVYPLAWHQEAAISYLPGHALLSRCYRLVAEWPLWRLPRGLLWYVCGVLAAGTAVAVTVGLLTSWRGRDLALFAMLVTFGGVAVELTRRTTVPAGLIKDVHGIWQLPIALLLPPFYCLVAPIVTCGMLQLRNRRTVAHRRVFSAAANGLSLAAASAAFHAVLPVLQGQWPAARSAVWLLAAVACAVVWSAVDKVLIMAAVKASDRTTSVRAQLLAREPLLNDLCEISAGVLLTGTVAGVGVVLLVPALPLVILLQRSFRQAQLISQARIDTKTGLLNAAAWRTEATVGLAQAQRTRSPVALAIADLDHFKAVNDGYGHLTGDAVLAAAASTLREGLRPYDLIGRFGGEEFTILFPHTTAGEAVAIADRLRASLASYPFPAGEDRDPLHVTVSIGVAAAPDADGQDLTDLLTAADAALYAAKTSGRNTVRLDGETGPAREPASR